MFCRNCGKQINDKSKFCQFCGYNLQENKSIDTKQNDTEKTNITTNNINVVVREIEEEFIKNKATTLFLFLFPFTSLWGIHHFYNKRHLRGILYISLSLIFNMLLDTSFIDNNFFVAIITVFLFIYFFTTDLLWIMKLPKFYFVKNKYSRNKVILCSLIPIFIFFTNFVIVSKTGLEVVDYENNIINKLELTDIEKEKFLKALNELGIDKNSIINIEYDPILEGMYTYSKNENPNGTEDGYRITLNNGEKISVYVENGIFLAIYYLDAFIYENGKVVKQIDEVEKEIQEKTKNVNIASNFNKSNFELVGDLTTTTSPYGYNRFIEGVVWNNSHKKATYVQITFNLYDSNGNKVGTAIDNISGLESGGTWKFKALILKDEATNFSLDSIKGY